MYVPFRGTGSQSTGDKNPVLISPVTLALTDTDELPDPINVSGDGNKDSIGIIRQTRV